MLEVTCLGLETEEGTAEEGRLTSLCSPPRLRTRGAAVTWWAGTEIERDERREGRWQSLTYQPGAGARHQQFAGSDGRTGHQAVVPVVEAEG